VRRDRLGRRARQEADKSTGSKTVVKDGRRVAVKVYPRLRGAYLLQPAGKAPRIAVTSLTLKR